MERRERHGARRALLECRTRLLTFVGMPDAYQSISGLSLACRVSWANRPFAEISGVWSAGAETVSGFGRTELH